MREVFGERFDGAAGFLNSATYGLPSQRTSAALRHALRAWELGELAPADFDESVRASREAFAALTGTDAQDVALGGAVSPLLGLIAASLPDGARVGTAVGEFTSVSAPFAVQAPRGVTVTALPLGELERRAGEFDLVAVSVVQSSDGRVLDEAALRASVADRGTVVVLDATQAAGWKRLELGWADAVVGGSYKWLLSPRGAAWLALKPSLAERLIPHAASWYSSETPWANTYELPPRLAVDARRFDASPAWFTLLGAATAMPWLASLDAHALEAHCVGLADALRAELELPASPSAIVALEAPGAAEALEATGIRAAIRAGRARVGFHVYNTEDDVARLLTALGR